MLLIIDISFCKQDIQNNRNLASENTQFYVRNNNKYNNYNEIFIGAL